MHFPKSRVTEPRQSAEWTENTWIANNLDGTHDASRFVTIMVSFIYNAVINYKLKTLYVRIRS